MWKTKELEGQTRLVFKCVCVCVFFKENVFDFLLRSLRIN